MSTDPAGRHSRRPGMKTVVIGGSGLIGKKLIPLLRGHEAVSASSSSGVNTLTGEGLSEALAGADVVVDVTNSPSFAGKAVLEFFETSTRNILAAEAAAGVKHHVALSVVGNTARAVHEDDSGGNQSPVCPWTTPRRRLRRAPATAPAKGPINNAPSMIATALSG